MKNLFLTLSFFLSVVCFGATVPASRPLNVGTNGALLGASGTNFADYYGLEPGGGGGGGGGSLTNMLASAQTPIWLFDGDSQIDNSGTPGFANAVSQLVWTNGLTNRFSVQNVAVAGSTVASVLAADRGYQFRNLGTNQLGIYSIPIGINSVLAGASSNSIFGDLTNLWGRWRARGYVVHAFTPFGTNTLTSAQHTQYVGLCQLIRTATNHWDYLTDAATNTAITLSDGLHPSNSGSTAYMRQIVQTLGGLVTEGPIQPAPSFVGQANFSANRDNSFAIQLNQAASLRFKLAGANPYQGAYWAGVYGDSLRMTGESTNGMDSLLWWVYGVPAMRLYGDPSGTLPHRLYVGQNAATNAAGFTNGYTLNVSGHIYGDDITAGAGITGVLRGRSGGIHTNTAFVNGTYYGDGNMSIWNFGSSNVVSQGLSTNNNHGLSLPNGTFVTRAASGNAIVLATDTNKLTLTTNGNLEIPNGLVAPNLPGTGPILSVDGDGQVVRTLFPTNALTLIATNATAVALDFTSGNPRFRMDQIHASLTVNPTNIVDGREICLVIHNTSGATRTITVSTNGWGGAIRWNAFPARSGNVVNLTNNSTFEVSLKCEGGVMLPVGGLAQ